MQHDCDKAELSETVVWITSQIQESICGIARGLREVMMRDSATNRHADLVRMPVINCKQKLIVQKNNFLCTLISNCTLRSSRPHYSRQAKQQNNHRRALLLTLKLT